MTRRSTPSGARGLAWKGGGHAIGDPNPLSDRVFDERKAGEVPGEKEPRAVEALEVLVDTGAFFHKRPFDDPQRLVRTNVGARGRPAAVGRASDDRDEALHFEDVERARVDTRVAPEAGARIDLRKPHARRRKRQGRRGSSRTSPPPEALHADGARTGPPEPRDDPEPRRAPFARGCNPGARPRDVARRLPRHETCFRVLGGACAAARSTRAPEGPVLIEAGRYVRAEGRTRRQWIPGVARIMATRAPPNRHERHGRSGKVDVDGERPFRPVPPPNGAAAP
jgi:hypothetical protein